MKIKIEIDGSDVSSNAIHIGEGETRAPNARTASPISTTAPADLLAAASALGARDGGAAPTVPGAIGGTGPAPFTGTPPSAPSGTASDLSAGAAPGAAGQASGEAEGV
jgi:hypothetical protein